MCMKPTDAAPLWAHSFFKSDGREPLHCRLPFCTSARWAVGHNWGSPFVQCFYSQNDHHGWHRRHDYSRSLRFWCLRSKEATGIGWTSCDTWCVFYRLSYGVRTASIGSHKIPNTGSCVFYRRSYGVRTASIGSHKIPNTGSHAEIQCTLVGMGSTALAAAGALPR